jgi:hypothetical protein
MPQDDISVEGWFERHADTEVTVWFVEKPQATLTAQWVGQDVYASLDRAVKAVSDDAGNHFGYDVILHEPEGDRRVSQRELVALIAIYRRKFGEPGKPS